MVGDVAAVRQALDIAGAVIMRQVVGKEQLAEAEHLFFDWLESLPLDIDQRTPCTMRDTIWRRLGYADTGVKGFGKIIKNI
jgi:hypothetical protein